MLRGYLTGNKPDVMEPITPLIHRVLDTMIQSDSAETTKLRHVTETLQLADPAPTFNT